MNATPRKREAAAKLPVSEQIRSRLQQAGRRFHANDTIHDVLEPGEVEELVDEVQGRMQEVLEALVIDTDSDHNTQDTARRIARMYVTEVFRGRYFRAPTVTQFPNAERLNELMIVGPVKVRSACSHHFCPIIGHVWIGLMPNEHSKLIGLSKYVRLTDWIMTPAADPGRGDHPAGRTAGRQDEARRAGRGDGGRPFLHALARREGRERAHDHQRHARRLPQGSLAAARIPVADTTQILKLFRAA